MLQQLLATCIAACVPASPLLHTEASREAQACCHAQPKTYRVLLWPAKLPRIKHLLIHTA